MTFPQILEQVWQMDNSDINVVGEHLGYDWNEVCDAINKANFYAEDGAGTFTVSRLNGNNYSRNEIINKIFTSIFENYPQVNKISVSNDF